MTKWAKKHGAVSKTGIAPCFCVRKLDDTGQALPQQRGQGRLCGELIQISASRSRSGAANMTLRPFPVVCGLVHGTLVGLNHLLAHVARTNLQRRIGARRLESVCRYFVVTSPLKTWISS